MKGTKVLVAGVIVASMAIPVAVWAGCGACGTHAKVEKKAAACGAACAGKSKAACAAACAAKADSLSTEQLNALLKSDKAVTVLDARSGKWDDGRRIPGATALSAASSPEDIAKVIKSKDAAVVTYCSNLKCGASGKLAGKLKSLGYTNVKEYPEGIAGWADSGNKVEKAGS
jgi:rhodanese-related sulfurtransferase